MSEASDNKSVFSVNNEINSSIEKERHYDYIDIILPVIIIATGVLQFVVRKWLFPVSDEVVTKLENQAPTQGLLYRPGFGLFFIVVGAILLIVSLLTRYLNNF